MSTKTAMLTKSLVQHFFPKPIESLVSYAQEEYRTLLINLPSVVIQQEHLCPSAETLLSTIHYSWFLEPLKNYSKPLQQVLIHTTPIKIQKKLCSLLEIETSTACSSFFQRHLQEKFVAHFYDNPNLVPYHYLPESELTPLLKMSKENIVKLIDLLPIYDLAKEIPKVLNKETLTIIQHSLSKRQKHFLNHCIKNARTIGTKGSQLTSSCESIEQFRHKLHLQGLNRLGTVLIERGFSFIWHLTHKLDTGRGKKVLKFINKKSDIDDYIQTLLTKQLTNIIDMYFSPQKGTT